MSRTKDERAILAPAVVSATTLSPRIVGAVVLAMVTADFVNSAPEPAREASIKFAHRMLDIMIEQRRDAGGVGQEIAPVGELRH